MNIKFYSIIIFKNKCLVNKNIYLRITDKIYAYVLNNASDPDSIGDCYNVKKLEKQVILDRTTLEKRISGGEKAAKTKKISELEDTIAELSVIY